MTDFLTLTTRDLRLVAATPGLLRAEIRDGSPAALLGVAPPLSWPPDLYERDDLERALEAAETPGCEAGWQIWYLTTHDGRLAGIAGLGGPAGFLTAPTRVVMLGYSVLGERQRRGFATQATEALTAFAFADPRVERVAAETFPALVASIRVLEKCGFTRQGTPHTPGAIRFERTR